MLRTALDAGLSAEAFWRMSPAAVLRVARAWRRGDRQAAPQRIGSLAECP